MLTHCKLSKKNQLDLLKLFVCQVTARTAAIIIGINYKTAQLFYTKLRRIIAENQSSDTPFQGFVEVDESYFGGTRKGERGRGAAGKIPVFGLLKRGGKVYACMVKDTKSDSLIPIIKDCVKLDSIVYSDNYRSYNSLDVSGFHHFRINHKTDFALGENHINGIENFWNQAKRILRKYNGIQLFPCS